MKKVTIIVRAHDAAVTVADLRGLGVLHVEQSIPVQSDGINELKEDLSLIDEALNILQEASPGQAQKELALPPDWKVCAKHIVDLSKRREQLEVFSKKLLQSVEKWLPWGDFDPSDITALEQKGVYAKLCLIPLKRIKELSYPLTVKVISTQGAMANCIIFSKEKFQAPFKEIALPKQGLFQMQKRLDEDRKVVSSLREEIKKLSVYIGALRGMKKDLGKKLEFQEALAGMQKEGELSYIRGYVPFDIVKIVSQEATIKQWAVIIDEPAEDAFVPTLIRNPRWVSIISPVFKLLEIVPGYRELDTSLFFLMFFSLFFGILIGDAGYGLVYLLVTFFIQKKMGKNSLSAEGGFFLFYLLSFCAIIWGVLTGSVFGQGWLVKSGFKPLVPALGETKNIQSFCFFIGALHLSLAHSWRAILKFPSLSFLSDIGWVLLLWAAYFFAKLLILSQALPFYGRWLLIAGVILVILFTDPQKNIFKAIGQGAGALALSLMNSFTDVVSYVRLFAVALAGVAIADTFNSMASGAIASGKAPAIIAGVFIITGGHCLNLILGPMSVLVHGVRLNILEFCGHANVTWSGIAYKPLKE
jgi:V/A-type H+-transporting ATPase subunit I